MKIFPDKLLLSPAGNTVPGHWGNCGNIDDELVQETFSNSVNTCSNSPFFVCTAVSNYGYVNVDFESRELEMGFRTPYEGQLAFHRIKYSTMIH